MRTFVSLRFWGHHVPGGAQAVLGPAGIGPDAVVIEESTFRGIHQIRVNVSLPEGDERISKLVDLLKQHDYDPLIGGFDRYTDEELDNARLLVLRAGFEIKVDGGEEFGTTYDLTGACPNCGAGARQTSAMFLDGWDDQVFRTLEGHRAANTLGHDILVDDRIAAELQALAPTGLALHQVYALMPETKRQVKLAYKQLSADRILPPMAPQTENLALLEGQTPQCSLCMRSGYWAASCLRVAYRQQDLEGAGDVNLSWEGQRHGLVSPNPRECRIPTPLILVTPKVMRVFRAAGITEFEFIPIRVVNE